MLSEYIYRNELHAHTCPVSPCSDITAEEMIDIYDSININSIVLTNHFYPGYFQGKDISEGVELYLNEYGQLKRYGAYRDISVLLGMEIRFSENDNDYLIYGIDEQDVWKASQMLDYGIARFYTEFKNSRNVIFQAHPFRKGMVPADTRFIDGIETFNMHPGHNSRVAFASKYASERGLLECGGTDFHHREHQGGCITLTRFIPESSYDIAEILKNQDFLMDIWGRRIIPGLFLL